MARFYENCQVKKSMVKNRHLVRSSSDARQFREKIDYFGNFVLGQAIALHRTSRRSIAILIVSRTQKWNKAMHPEQKT
jgi:hypothetical protein